MFHARPLDRAVTDDGLLAHTGPTYFPVALLARLPFAMTVVGVLTLVVTVRGSTALGGANSAAVGIGAAIGGTLLGSAADRWGQRRVLVPVGLVNAALLAALPFVVASPAADAVVLLLALLVGATGPQVAPLSRSRLVAIIRTRLAPHRRERTLAGTMSYESAADETVFIVGPLLVGVLASAIAPWVAVAGAAVLSAVFVTWFAIHPTWRLGARPTGTPASVAPRRALVAPGLLLVVAGTLCVGLFFGATLTSVTAFLEASGHGERAGLLYGLMGIGSASLALGSAWFSPRFSLRARWIVFGGVMVLGTAALPFAETPGGIGLVLAFTGFGVGPTLVAQYSLAADLAPRGRSATTMTMLGSAVIVGQSASSAVVGVVADGAGVHVAMLGPVVAAGLVVLIAAASTLNARGRRPAP